MICVILEEDVSTLSIIKDMAEHAGYKVLTYTNPFEFFTHFDHADIYEYLFLVSDEALEALCESADSIIRHYDLRVPLFAYNLDNFILKLSMNYLDFYCSLYSKKYILHLLKIKEMFVKLAKDSKTFLGNYTFSENIVTFHYAIQKHCHGNILGDDSSSATYNKTSILSYFSKTQQKLFRYLCLNKDGVSIREIAMYMWGIDSPDKRANAYTIISHIRKILEKNIEYKYELHHINRKYKLVQN